MQAAARRFQAAAVAFCDALAQPPLDARVVLSLTVGVVAAALDLPDVEPESDAAAPDPPGLEAESAAVSESVATLGVDGYWEVFDPRELGEPVGGSLTDDLVDVYRDLRRGLALADVSLAEVVWEWKFSYETHWGNHATDAIRLLHRVVTD